MLVWFRTESQMLGVSLTIFIVIFLLYLRWRRRHIIRLGSEMGSGIWTLPFVGHSYLFAGGCEALMKAFHILGIDAIRNGGMASFWLGPKLYAMVADPAVAEVVMKTCLEKDDIMRFATLVIGNGSLFAPVRIWRKRRKMLLPVFTMKNLKQYIQVFSKQSGVLVEQLRGVVGTGTFAVWKYFTAYTMDNIAEVALGYEMKAQGTPNHPFLKTFEEGLALIAERVMLPWLHNDAVYKKMHGYRRQMEHKEFLWGVVGELIQSKRKELKDNEGRRLDSDQVVPEDGFRTFLDVLASVGEENFSDVEITEEMIIMMVAGNDTSAAGASFVTLMLARHMDVQNKIYQELQEVFENTDRQITMEDVSRLKYLDAVVRETLRLYPPVPVITRKVERNVVLPNGLTLLPGCGVMINIWAMQRNPQHWGEDAEVFRPERFLDADKHPAFMPFSSGSRNCLGYQFAMISMKVALSALLRQYKILPGTVPVSPKQGHPPIRLRFDLTMKDFDNFEIQIESRTKC